MPSTTTAFCASSISNRPSGARRTEACTIPFTVSSLRPSSFILSWLKERTTSFSYCPAICTDATPSISSSVETMSFSAIRVRFSRSAESFSDKLKETTGIEFMLKRIICDFIAPSGSVNSFNASRTAAVALSKFAP
ncbi:hypothetical protein D3C77_506870 [compost metagenome]